MMRRQTRAGLSKSKLLSYRQCPRRLWLEVKRPDLAEVSAATEAVFEVGHQVGEIARRIYGSEGGTVVPFEPGLREAIATTRTLLERNDGRPIFEATFDHRGVLVRVDVLLREGRCHRLVEVKASTSLKELHIEDCAIQAWVLEQEGLDLARIALAHVDNRFVYAGDGDYRGLLVERDVTDEARSVAPEVERWVEDAREVLAGIEPEVAVGIHCFEPYECPFFGRCAPRQGRYPVTGLGGGRRTLFDWMHAGYCDIREVPREWLSGKQLRIYDVTVRGEPELLPAARDFACALPYPRYYLDFETASFAVPIWAGTRPYQALPFQWSCHVEEGPGTVRHEEFLDLSGQPPMRPAAEALIAALGTEGPILTYTGYEDRMINTLQELYPDLAPPLAALRDRIVDLHPPTRDCYYHPDMLGSWSLKAVIPTVAPDLCYQDLNEVQEGSEAERAYLEAIHPETSPERRAAIRQALLDYCRRDTLSLLRLVEFFDHARPGS